MSVHRDFVCQVMCFGFLFSCSVRIERREDDVVQREKAMAWKEEEVEKRHVRLEQELRSAKERRYVSWMNDF